MDAQTVANRLPGWIAGQYPEATAISLDNLRSPGGGYSNETWLFDLVWTRKGHPSRLPLVFRLQPTEAGTFPEYDLAFQYRCMERLAGSGIPVPRLFGFCADSHLMGAPFYLMEQIPGRAPAENPPYALEGWLKDSFPEDQRKIWEQGVDILAAVARLDWRALGFTELDRPALGATPLAQMIAQYRSYLVWVERRRRPYPFLHQALDWVEAHPPADEPVTLCWGDAKLGNLMFEGSHCTAALDWESAHLGNPVSDLGWMLMLDFALSEAIGIPRLPGFPDRAQTRARWEAQSGFSARDLEYYEFFSAMKFATIMASITWTFIRKGLLPEDTTMDIRNTGTAALEIYSRRIGLDLGITPGVGP
ncbi:MAG: phosphotransferase family protein [Proteobacteria bacterium]|nr:phosphotransferase family protein [Pseudomonadota bacterium]HQR04123.1 phosphotransferase family protein [Rhodocyclaceae bacterium]